MSRSTDRAASGGFLLLEALVALAIVGVVAVALLGAVGAQVRSADKGSVLLTASALAQDRAVSFRVLDVEALRRPPDSLVAGVFPPPFDDFRWEAEVEAVDGEDGLFALEVVVLGRGERFPLQTLLHRSEPPLVLPATPLQPAGGGGGGE